MKTYRYRGHSRSDPAKYRPEGELERWKARDPIDLLGAKLVAEGVIGPNDQAEIRDETQADDRRRRRARRGGPVPDPRGDASRMSTLTEAPRRAAADGAPRPS